jgi:hypothetical protein
MSTPLAKLIPTATLIAILGYLCWSYLDQGIPASSPPNKLPEVAADLLRPKVPDETDRDPFGESLKFEMGEHFDAKGHSKTRPGVGTAATPAAVPRTAGAAAAQPGAAEGTGAARPVAAAKAAGAKAGGDAGDRSRGVVEVRTAVRTADNLVLNATLLYGAERSALINGRVYRQGDAIEESGTGSPQRVAEIHQHLVVLECDGQPLHLRYADMPSGDKPAGRNPGGARPAGSRASAEKNARAKPADSSRAKPPRSAP